MPTNRDPSRRPSPLHRPARPPPPPRPPVLEGSKPTRSSDFEPPPGSPTLQQREKPRANAHLRSRRLHLLTRIALFVLAPLGLLGALLGLRPEGGETDAIVPTPMTQTTPTAAESVQPEAVLPTDPSSVSAQLVPGQEPDWELLARSVVDIWSPGCEWGGSGTIVLDGSYVLTNAHVVNNPNGSNRICDLIAGFTDKFTDPPDHYVPAEAVLVDTELDLALLRLLDRNSGKPIIARGRMPIDVQQRDLRLGEPISALGYPGVGGLSITYSEGSVSGTIDIPAGNEGGTGEFIKTTDLNLNHGNSGGAAFDSKGQFVGVPTAGFGTEVVCEGEACFAEGSSVGLIRPSSYARQLLAQVP